MNQGPDVAALEAIDVHVHAEVSAAGHHSLPPELERWLADFAALPIKDEVRSKILLGNAARLLGLDAG